MVTQVRILTKLACTWQSTSFDVTIIPFLPYFLANVCVEISHVNTQRSRGKDSINMVPGEKLGINEH